MKAYKINEQGFYIEDYIYEEGQELNSNIITTELPQSLHKPKWDGTKWVEGATQEEIDKGNYINPTQKTEIEILKETVDALVLANLGV